MHDTTFEQITENLKRALDIVENCGEAYKNASDTIKKLMNQAIFEKFYISNDADMEFKVDAEFRPPFDQILEPVKDDIIRINRLAQDCSSKLSYYIGIAKDHIQEIFGCGLYIINNSTNMSTYSNGSNFFSHNSSSKVLLVELVAILIMLGSATTVSCFVMAKNMGHEGVLTSSVVMLTTLFSAFTVTAWLYILRSLGLI